MSLPAFELPPNPARVSKDLLNKYTTRGPRYTSYPTAPQFTPDIDADELSRLWKAGSAALDRPDLSLYLHIPFCAKRCWFCGCFTQVGQSPDAADPYLDSLIAEFSVLAELLDAQRPVQQLALGGGTPTFLTPERFDRMMRALKAVYRFAPDAERSVEIDPRSVRPGHVDVLLDHGFNRFSLGIQDFDETVQKLVHREQDLGATLSLVDALRAGGRNAINFDLIYGLPGQSEASMQRTAERTAKIGPSRIALFSYAHVPWMKSHQKALERNVLPSPDEKLAMFGVAWDVLTAAGYVPIGMDHFARPDDELALALENRSLHRNFMGYTTRRGLDQAAFGASGISAVSGTYAQNTKDMHAYAAALADGRPSFERGYILSRDDLIRRELIIDLFCNFHLDGAAFGERFGIEFAQTFAPELANLKSFVDDGLVAIDGATIDVTPLGRAFVRNVCMVFDRYLEADPEQRRYSQTV
jgi:oxygen-independent coproporphyrinogen-3 oxidase